MYLAKSTMARRRQSLLICQMMRLNLLQSEGENYFLEFLLMRFHVSLVMDSYIIQDQTVFLKGKKLCAKENT